MHELGVVFHVIDSLKSLAAENEVEKISKVTLELGEVSTVIEYYLRDVWNWAIKKHELLEDCELVVEKIPAVTYCTSCEKTYETVKYGKKCPYCESEETYLIQGNEFVIKEIEVWDPEDEEDPSEPGGSQKLEENDGRKEERDSN